MLNIQQALDQDNCVFFGCANQIFRNSSQADVINPFLFFTDKDAICQYAEITSCCSLDTNSGSFFQFLKPFCMDLLPFCIFYSFIRMIVSIVNYIFIYRKKIEDRLRRSRDALLMDNLSPKNDYIDKFKMLLKASFILDMFTCVFSLWIFKGYQYYASQYSVAPHPDLALLGSKNAYALFVCVIFWLIMECCRTYIQIFSVSSLTHLDNLKKESQRHQEEKFYMKHRKFAFWWTIVFFIVGNIFLIPSFWTENTSFNNYKLYYKYFSTETISFWLSYALISILILTDRILAYDGFKKRQEFRNRDRRPTGSFQESSTITNITNPENYQIVVHSSLYNDVRKAVVMKFPEKSPEEIDSITTEVSRIYNDKMRQHIGNLKEKMKGGNEEQMTIETSMSYVRYLRLYNILNLIGYAMILFSYQHKDERNPGSYLPLYMLGFTISSIATFAYELTHNYLLYRSYFLQVLAKMNRKEEEAV